MLYFIDFIILASIYYLFFYKKWIKKSKKELIINTIMYVYIAMVLYVTLMPFTIPVLLGGIRGGNNLFMQTANFIPFRDLRANYNGAVREIILNIIMMIPFGFIYPINKIKGFFRTVTLTFLFSLIIESSQLLGARQGGAYARNFDVTDLITNTIGGLIGYLFFIILGPIVYKVLKR